ncbi:MAG: molybdopterin dinucleotide binding domain-containing protein, partial [Methylotenera sp.]|nr:molybdopterin dinucleotide binding domain-containing protein [Methylotenera sp.]
LEKGLAINRTLSLSKGATKTLFPYSNTEEIFNEHRETTRGRDLDISGLSYDLLNKQGPQQWPFVTGDIVGKARLYTDGVFEKPDGRAQFVNVTYKGTADKTDARHPLHLLTGRLRDQWHGMSRTGSVAQLFNHAEEAVIHMSADDMTRRSIKHGDIVKVSNKRGSLVLPAQTSNEVKPSQTFIAMHWGSQFMHGLGVNALMPAAFDKTSKQPELKHTAIKIEKLELPWRMTVMRTIQDLSLLQKVRVLLTNFEYASCGLFGRATEHHAGMLVLRAAHKAAPEATLIAEIDAILGMTDDMPLLNYIDAKRGVSKRILVENNLSNNNPEVTGVRLVGETLASDWLKDVMTTGEFSPELRRWALAPLSLPPAGQRSRGKIICNCLDVAENDIIDTIQLGADLITLQNKLKCGTECGSCVPELKRLVLQHGIKIHAL